MVQASFLRCVVTIGAAFLAVAACSNRTVGSRPAGQSEIQAISRAVFADGRLWLLNDNGSLVSLAVQESTAEPTKSPGKVLEICKSDGRLTAVTEEGRGTWILQQRPAGAWTTLASIPTQGDTFVALACEDDSSRATLVTNRRLIELGAGRNHAVRLKQPFEEPWGISTTLATDAAIWIGFNVGEWGGGLRRVSRKDGSVQTIARNSSRALCGGPLNTACDPVNGIIAAPWNQECVVAAIGLVHMMPHGRIVEVCGNNVRRLYFKPLDPQPPNNRIDEGEPASTVAFFGLTRTGNTWWAVGIDGLYRFDGAHQPDFVALPKFEKKGGYWISFDVPGVALVLTDVNQRRSMSGPVPIMALR